MFAQLLHRLASQLWDLMRPVISVLCGENRMCLPLPCEAPTAALPATWGVLAPLALPQPPPFLLPQVICCEGNAGFYEVGCVSTPLEGRPWLSPLVFAPWDGISPIFPHGHDFPWPGRFLWSSLKASLWGNPSPFALRTSHPCPAVCLTFHPPHILCASEPLVGVISPSSEGSSLFAPGRGG